MVKEKSYFFAKEGRAGKEGPAGCAHLAGRGRSPELQGTVSQRHRVRSFRVFPGAKLCKRAVGLAGGVGYGYFALGAGGRGFESRPGSDTW